MIEIIKLNKNYNDEQLFNNASAFLPKTGFGMLVGENGSGKTTLFNILSGIEENYEGNVLINNQDIKAMIKENYSLFRCQMVANVFQDYKLFKGYTALENVMVKAMLCQKSEADAKAILDIVGLAGKYDKCVNTLSGGEKQRVAIATAIISNPQILLCDEPTSALDDKNAAGIMKLLSSLSKNMLVVCVTHDSNLTKEMDFILEIKNQKLEIVKKSLSEQQDPINIKKSDSNIKYSKLGFKNIKVSLIKILVISLFISLGLAFVISSLTINRLVDKAITTFVDNNSTLNNVLVNTKNETDLSEVFNDKRVSYMYYRYEIPISSLASEEKIDMPVHKPRGIAKLAMIHGKMPNNDELEIVVSPSLAKKLAKKSLDLIGQNITYYYSNEDVEYEVTLKVSGIINYEYDYYVLSRKIEQQVYKDIAATNVVALSMDIPKYQDIVDVTNEMVAKGFVVTSASEEIMSLDKTFNSLKIIFMVISLVLFICSICGGVLMLTRYYKERQKLSKQYLLCGYLVTDTRHILIIEIIIHIVIVLLMTTVLSLAFSSIFTFIFH